MLASLYTWPSFSGFQGIRDNMLRQLCSQRTGTALGRSRVGHAEQTRGPNHHLNNNTLASLEASKPGGAAAKQSLEKYYYQKMDKSKGVLKIECKKEVMMVREQRSRL